MGRPLKHIPDNDEAQRAKKNPPDSEVNVDEHGKVTHTKEAKQQIKKAKWIEVVEEENTTAAEIKAGQAQNVLSRMMDGLEKDCDDKRPDGHDLGSTWSAPPDGNPKWNAYRPTEQSTLQSSRRTVPAQAWPRAHENIQDGANHAGRTAPKRTSRP